MRFIVCEIVRYGYKVSEETVLVELWAAPEIILLGHLNSILHFKKMSKFYAFVSRIYKMSSFNSLTVEVDVWTAFYSHEIDIVRIITCSEGNFNEL